MRGWEDIQQTVERRGGIARVHRADDEVARLGNRQRGFDRLLVAELADNDSWQSLIALARAAGLNDMAERWNLDDIRMFVVSISVQNETGGNLAEILDKLASLELWRSGPE